MDLNGGAHRSSFCDWPFCQRVAWSRSRVLTYVAGATLGNATTASPASSTVAGAAGVTGRLG